MRKSSLIATVLVSLLTSSAAISGKTRSEVPEAELASLDLEQKVMVAKADVQKLAALAAPGLTINAPTGRVLAREQFLAMMRNGQIGAEEFQRRIESVTVSGDVGVVMGSEIFTPTAKSELGRMYGAVPLRRRYTNVYVRDHGHWLWFARHANVVAGPQ